MDRNLLTRTRGINRGRRAFTLIELLTVIAIIGILAAILVPVVGTVRANARSAHSASNLRQLALGVRMYAQDNKDRLLPGQDRTGTTNLNWVDVIWPYVAQFRRTYTTAVRNTVIFGPGWDSDPRYNSGNHWDLGYGMNTAPGMPLDKTQNWMTKDFVATFYFSRIERPERRLLFVESANWNIDSDTVDDGHIAFGRNGAGVNVAFFTGHVAKLNDPERVYEAVRKP